MSIATIEPPSPITPGALAGADGGRLRCSVVDGKTVVREAIASNPLKLLCLTRDSGCAWIFAGAYGGGLVAGDHVRLQATFDAGTRCFLGTQASTKIYRAEPGQISRQSLNAAVGADGLCVAVPDPITCFATARFQQRQRWHLAESASLVLVDWLTSGRYANGERWAFDRYDSRIDVHVAGKHRVRETLLLDAADGPIGSRSRMGRCDCFATMLLVGPILRSLAERILQCVTDASLAGAGLLIAASPLADGAIVRIAGQSAQAVGDWMHEQLSPITAALGEAPWGRKR